MLFPALLALAGPAAARPNPEPPPSGIVVHLFGLGSITSNILPSLPGARPRPSGAASAGMGMPGAGVPGGPEDATASAGSAAADPYDPTMGQVLHQMFVVGDPDQKPGASIAPGRAAEHPRALNP